MGRTTILLLSLAFVGLNSVHGYKLIDGNLQDDEVEDPDWNQVIGNSKMKILEANHS